MSDYKEVVDAILERVNSVSTTGDAGLIATANELAAGVTAEREAEICAEELPIPYTFETPARAQIDGDTIRVPRSVNTAASWTPDGGWNTGTSMGRRLRRQKADCAVGVHVDLDIPDVVKILRIVVLWRRVK